MTVSPLDLVRRGPASGSVRLAACPRRTFGCILLVVTITPLSAAEVKPKVVQAPSRQEVQAFAQRLFGQQSGYQEGDVITQGMVKKLLSALNKKGWGVADPGALLERVLPDDDFLVKQFSDAKGRQFLRKVESLPGGIDRVDRLARMPQGHASVNDLIRKVPNGTDWIEAMVTTKRGHRLGERLSNSASGKDFNEPTGRIYTLAALLEALDGQLVAVSEKRN